MNILCWCCLSPAWDSADNEREALLKRTLTVVGDGACGKTCLLLRISRGTFSVDSYDPTCFEKDDVEIFRGRRKMRMILQDSPGQDSYDRLRPTAYADVDVILMCFSLDNPDSLANVENQWIQEVRHYCQDVPVILVGNKKDLRDEWKKINPKLKPPDRKFVTTREGKAAASRIKAKDYLECSAKANDGVKRVLGTAIRYATLRRTQQSSRQVTSKV